MEELLNQCLSDDLRAWEVFFLNYSSKMKHIIKKTLRASEFCKLKNNDDVIEDIFMGIVDKLYAKKKLRYCRDQKGFDFWLGVVVRNHTIDWLKSYRRRKANNSDNDLYIEELYISENVDLDHNYAQKAFLKKDLISSLIEGIMQIKNCKLKWTLRLSVIAEVPLDNDEITALANDFHDSEELTVQNEIKCIAERLEKKKEKQSKARSKAVHAWHDIIRLERKRISLINYTNIHCEVNAHSIRDQIAEKNRQRDALLDFARKPCRPSNSEIASLIGLKKSQVQHVSTYLVRAREMINFYSLIDITG